MTLLHYCLKFYNTDRLYSGYNVITKLTSLFSIIQSGNGHYEVMIDSIGNTNRHLVQKRTALKLVKLL